LILLHEMYAVPEPSQYIQDSIADIEALELNSDQWPVYHGYEPLKPSSRAIRLIRLSRVPNTERVSCELFHEDLDSKPEYDALSYYWGAPSELETISLNGSDILICRNLHRFLQSLVARSTSLVVWLDVLCINQQDVTERNWQFRLMQEIFESAQNVYAWLGEGDADCKLAMRCVTANDQTATLAKSIKPQVLKQYLEQLFIQPYWTRIWIIQETVLAKNLWILYGAEKASWTNLAQTFDRVCRVDVYKSFPHRCSRTSFIYNDEADSNEKNTEGCRRFGRFKKAQESLNIGENTLYELVNLFRDASCTNPRDMSYGLRGDRQQR
jgi:hypothetical protein